MAPSLITFLTADTGASPDEGLTAGSHTIVDSGTALLNASAQVRGLLVDAAAITSASSAACCKSRTRSSRRPTAYHDLRSGGRRSRSASHGHASVAAKDPTAFMTIGTSLPRLDIPGKVTGGASYVQDMCLPGMLHARVVLPPVLPRSCCTTNTPEILEHAGRRQGDQDGACSRSSPKANGRRCRRNARWPREVSGAPDARCPTRLPYTAI